MPLYLQLKEAIKRKVARGDFLPGDKIPSERDLCRIFRVSRITVRQAIEAAVAEGLLYRQHGKGTYVAKPRIEQGLSRIVRFAETIRSQGLDPSTAVLGFDIVPADIQTAEVLRVDPGTGIVNLKLLGMGSGEPMVFYNSFLPYDLGMALGRKANEWASQGIPFSTYDLHDRNGSRYPVKARQAIEAAVANELISGILKVPQGSAVLVITTVFYDKQGSPIEFRTANYRGDKYRFYILRELE